MNLLDLAKGAAKIPPNHSIMIYAQPKMGKTRLAGTAAQLSEVKKIWWFDGENGSETLLNMGLTDEELAKITIFKIRDTKNEPIFIDTMLKALTNKSPVYICEGHGRIDCVECKKTGIPSVKFFLPDCKHDELVVIDSGSQLGDSAMAALCLGKDPMYKPGWDEYGPQGRWLSDMLSTVQAATYTNTVMITHEICTEDYEGKDKFFPLMGSKPFSMRCGKYFGTVVYLTKKLNKHVAGSSSTYMGDRLTGSRLNVRIEDAKEISMRSILIVGGILKHMVEQVVDEAKPQLKTEISKQPETKEVQATGNKLSQLLANRKS